MKTSLFLAFATAAALPLASAQQDRPPEPPRPPETPAAGRPEHPHGPRPDAPRERGPEAERHEHGPGPRDGDRRPDQRGPAPEGRGGHGDHADMPPRPEADRRDGPGRPRAMERRGPAMARPQRPQPYLGVITAPVPPPLAAQLGLPEGFGLLVDEVLPESPAARAGVQRYDVLKQLNDQQLIDSNQLATLVRSFGKDAEVSLTVLRKGGEQKLTAKIEERVLPERRPFPGSDELIRNLGPMRDRAERGARDVQERLQKWQREYGERMKDYGRRMQDFGKDLREFQELSEKWRGNPGSGPQPKKPEPPKPPEPPQPPKFDSAFEPAPADLLREVRPGGKTGVRVESDGNVTVWNTANARVFLKDDDGEVEVRSENGKRTVAARGPDGATIFKGPLDTEEQRAALPEAVRRKIERLDAQSHASSDAPLATSEATAQDAAPERDIQ